MGREGNNLDRYAEISSAAHRRNVRGGVVRHVPTFEEWFNSSETARRIQSKPIPPGKRKYCHTCGFAVRGNNHKDSRQHRAALAFMRANNDAVPERARLRIILDKARAEVKASNAKGGNNNGI